MVNWNKTLVKPFAFWYNLIQGSCRRGGMADTRDLKSLALKAYEFESRWRHQAINGFLKPFIAFLLLLVLTIKSTAEGNLSAVFFYINGFTLQALEF